VSTVEERIYALIEAYQAGDPGRFAADADVVDARGRWRRGRLEIEAAPSAPARSVSIRFLGAGDVALVHLGGDGVTTLVLSRERGTWRIDAAHSSGTKGD
jgi:hypothetical protein